VTHRWCMGLQRRDREKVLHGRESGTIKRLPHGEYVEVHVPLSQSELYRLTAHEQPKPYEIGPVVDAHGVARKVSRGEKLRARLGRAMFGPSAQIPKATPEEYLEIQHGGSETHH
ncbi:ubiquinol-cytochrome c reductase cytochrome b subunit, partial [Streptomyces sp. NPDC059900]